MNKELPPEQITVTLKAQPFDFEKYQSPSACYLADALHAAGYHDASVGRFGICTINDFTYKPKDSFSATILYTSFDSGRHVVVTLVRREKYNPRKDTGGVTLPSSLI